MVKLLKIHWPLIGAVLTFFIYAFILIGLSLNQTQRNYTYPLDDTYIHMAIAKNLALHGQWGIDKYEFTNSSSSPLWTSILALSFLIFGMNHIIPLILNFLIGILLLLVIYVLLRKFRLPSKLIFVTLLLVIFSTPMAPMVLVGLEHLMHNLITILFVYFASKLISDISETNDINIKEDKKLADAFSNSKNFITNSNKDFFALSILAPFLTTSRFEGLFLLLIVGGLLLLKRKISFAVLLVIIGIFPIVILGLISVAKGWFLLPNPVLMKANRPYPLNFETIYFLFRLILIQQLLNNPHILSLLLLAIVILFFRLKTNKFNFSAVEVSISTFILLVTLHLTFAQMGWLFRYEAYLVTLGIMVAVIGLYNSSFFSFSNNSRFKFIDFIENLLLVIILFYTFHSMYIRIIQSHQITPIASKNIYEQQYQMSLFIREFYNGQTIAANDVGAINYFADIRCIDLWGLANIEIAKLKYKNMYNTSEIMRIAKENNVKIAIVYDSWFQKYGGMPSSWFKAGEWMLVDNVICGDSKVSFYAVDTTSKATLLKNLKIFSKKLPKDIVQLGEYTKLKY